MNPMINFKGRFQVWSYTTSHGQLLLRRTKSNEYPTRIDVYFKNVAYMQLATVFDELHVTEATPESVPSLGALILADKKVYIVSGANSEGVVVAGTVLWNEDEGDYDDPSVFF